MIIAASILGGIVVAIGGVAAYLVRTYGWGE